MITCLLVVWAMLLFGVLCLIILAWTLWQPQHGSKTFWILPLIMTASLSGCAPKAPSFVVAGPLYIVKLPPEVILVARVPHRCFLVSQKGSDIAFVAWTPCP